MVFVANLQHCLTLMFVIAFAFLPDTSWSECLNTPLIGRLSLKTDPVGFYLSATSKSPTEVNIFEFDEFVEAHEQLQVFAAEKLRILKDQTNKKVIARHADILAQGTSLGFLSLHQLWGSLIEIAFHAVDGAVSEAELSTTWEVILTIFDQGGVPLPVVRRELMPRRELLEPRGVFVYGMQLTFDSKYADGHLMPPYRVLHHDSRHTIRKLMSDTGNLISAARAIFGNYLPPLPAIHQAKGEAKRSLLEQSNRLHRRFLDRLDAIPNETFRNHAWDTVYQLFHDGVNVPAYATMPWAPDFVKAYLGSELGYTYVLNHLDPVERQWPEPREPSLRQVLHWVRVNIDPSDEATAAKIAP